jgi:hypothetical protein
MTYLKEQKFALQYAAYDKPLYFEILLFMVTFPRGCFCLAGLDIFMIIKKKKFTL